MPDYKKAWPKYYYYYEWMRERIAAACGELPAPVLDKMLTQARDSSPFRPHVAARKEGVGGCSTAYLLSCSGMLGLHLSNYGMPPGSHFCTSAGNVLVVLEH